MTVGEINKSLEPVIECFLFSKKREHKKFAVVDTGFNGFLSAPNKLLMSLGWVHLGYEKYEIATGEIVQQKIYFGKIRFMGVEQNVVGVASQAKDVLLGTSLLNMNRCVIQIDFPQKIVRIQRK